MKMPALIENYAYGVLVGGSLHNHILMIPDNVNQILIERSSPTNVYCREDIQPPNEDEIMLGDVYTKYQPNFVTGDNYSFWVWYAGYGKRAENQAAQAFSLMNKNLTLDDFIVAVEKNTFCTSYLH